MDSNDQPNQRSSEEPEAIAGLENDQTESSGGNFQGHAAELRRQVNTENPRPATNPKMTVT
jgi:hypothetical protein